MQPTQVHAGTDDAGDDQDGDQPPEDLLGGVSLLPRGRLIGGEDLIVNPPATLKDGDRVKAKG
jgi:hypothetical protein